MLFDSHTHPHFQAYQQDTDAVIERALSAGVEMLLVGTKLSTSQKSIEVAERHTGAFAAVGLHPVHLESGYFDPNEEELPAGATLPTFVRQAEIFETEAYHALAKSSSKVRAIGETGLDYYRLTGSSKEQAAVKLRQQAAFEAQARLAGELNLALVVHCREAHDDAQVVLSNVLDEFPKLRVIMHCFTGTTAEAKRYLMKGIYLSFSGIVTFSHDWDQLIATMPLNQLLVETDAPYLTPVPMRGKKNEPAYVEHVVRHLAKLKNMSFEELAEATRANAYRVLDL